MQWVSVTFQAPWQACPQSHPSPDREQWRPVAGGRSGLLFPWLFTSLVRRSLWAYPRACTLLVQCPPSPVPRNLPEETSPHPCPLPLLSAPPIHRQIRQAGQQAACDRDLGSDTSMLGEPGKGPSSLCLPTPPLAVNGGNATLLRERESTDCKIPGGCLQVQVDPGLKQSVRDRQSEDKEICLYHLVPYSSVTAALSFW